MDRALVVVDPNTSAVQIARRRATMVNEIHRGAEPATRHLHRPELVDVAVRLFREARVRRVSSLLNRCGSPAAEQYPRAALEGSGAPVLAVFPEEPRIADQWLRGRPLQEPRALAAARALVCELEGVAPDWDVGVPADGVGA